MEKEESKKKLGEGPQISKMEPVTHGAYGGGMYGTEKGQQQEDRENEKKQTKAPASESQSADGPVDKDAIKFKHHPPSSGDRDIDITGQSYIHK
ncbi:hypothetical protein PIB30_009866 [Stylosanthes scabra]|uniref:Uncharacterized protein n=1 Tax=Stylosanthes scabra TaxID=79078 RepID=A0ABU6R5R3_9FABA|nr:hypothetical protein [Stylosanthes scabra]